MAISICFIVVIVSMTLSLQLKGNRLRTIKCQVLRLFDCFPWGFLLMCLFGLIRYALRNSNIQIVFFVSTNNINWWIAKTPGSLAVQCIVLLAVLCSIMCFYSCEGCPVSLDLQQRSWIFLSLVFPPSPPLWGSLMHRPALTPATMANNCRRLCRSGELHNVSCWSCSRTHGRFSGFNYISLAGRWGERN